MSPNFKQRVRVSSNASKQPNKKYPLYNNLSPEAKAARYKTKHVIGEGR